MSGHLPSIQPPRPQLAYSSSPNYDSSSAPSTISPQTPSSAGGGMALLGPQIGRPDIDGRHPYPAPVQLSPLDSGPRFSRDYEQMTMPPNLQETFSMNRGMAGSPIAPPPLQGGPLQAHKRAYRQRRKDPSCDACRERKVKVGKVIGNRNRVNSNHSVMRRTPRAARNVLVGMSSVNSQRRRIGACPQSSTNLEVLSNLY